MEAPQANLTEQAQQPLQQEQQAQEPQEVGHAEPEKPSIATPETVKNSEKAALNVHKKLSIQAAPVRQYLEATVVPVVMQGMQAVSKERPENPVEYLAYYLLSHNPQPSAQPKTQGEQEQLQQQQQQPQQQLGQEQTQGSTPQPAVPQPPQPPS